MIASGPPSEQPLPTGYYLDNFLKILDFVETQYRSLLSDEEQRYSRQFRRLSLSSQRLYVRLISRKGPHFRNDKLNYSEINDLRGCAEELQLAGYVFIGVPTPPEAALWTMTRPELVALVNDHPSHFSHVPAAKSLVKGQLIQTIFEAVPQVELEKVIATRLVLYTPLGLDHLQVFRLLFFGNLNQDLTEFVLLDLGLVRYEDYPISSKDRLFSNRAILDATLAYYACLEQVHLALEDDDREALVHISESLPKTLGEASLIRRRDRILNGIGRHFERLKQPQTALTFYGEATSHPARERRSRILAADGKVAEARDLCKTILETSENPEERDFARLFHPKMGKKLGLPVQTPKRKRHPTESLEIERDPNSNIEATVLAHLAASGIDGFYAENRFWLGLFGLFFWDVIFMPVRGAFFNHYQRAPVGLFSDRFRSERGQAIETRLKDIADGNFAKEQVFGIFDLKQGIANRLINWRTLTKPMIEKLLSLMDRRHLAALFDHMSGHLGRTRNGFPDLVVFNWKGRPYQLVEVKGPGDQLQNNQRRWLRFFGEQQIPYTIARISWFED